MRYLNLFIEYFLNVSLQKFDFFMGNIGKRFDSEMGIRRNGRNNLFPINYRIFIYNVREASMKLLDKPEN